jgi:uncharacterized protein with HEPN domain
MSNELLIVRFENIFESIELIEKRFKVITKADDFIFLEDGIDRLDAIAMRLQVIGEELKKIDKKDSEFLKQYPQIEWKKIKGIRDIISHHYVDINVEIIYDICVEKMLPLKSVVGEILSDLK